MAIQLDDRDPAQKLKDLHDWLMQNRVSARFPERQVFAPPPSTNAQARAEVQDFTNWLQEIQSPLRGSW
jgi:hypothetical protein